MGLWLGLDVHLGMRSAYLHAMMSRHELLTCKQLARTIVKCDGGSSSSNRNDAVCVHVGVGNSLPAPTSQVEYI